jgi:hypothetical protein
MSRSLRIGCTDPHSMSSACIPLVDRTLACTYQGGHVATLLDTYRAERLFTALQFGGDPFKPTIAGFAWLPTVIILS